MAAPPQSPGRNAEALTIVVPVYNEAPCIPDLVDRLDQFLAAADSDTRVLFVDDGSTDRSLALIKAACRQRTNYDVLKLSQNGGLSAALKAGIDHCRTPWVGYIDADLQTSPMDFLALLPHCGSQYALLMRTLHSGIPGRLSYDVQQDDLIVNCISRLGTMVRESEMPNCVVRIYLPPAEQWENRSGPHYGFRMGLTTTTQKKSRGLFASRRPTTEPYWPGMWIHFRSEGSRGVESDSAFIKVRGDRFGRDFEVLEIDQFGWWTLGMSMTADGAIHYFASPGVDALTAEDHLTTQFPYSFRGERFRTFFFNVCNRNDGASWSTPFVIDDPQLFLVDASRINAIVQQKKERELAQETARRQKEAATTGR